MEQQNPIDEVFLTRLEERYRAKELSHILTALRRATIIVAHSTPIFPPDMNNIEEPPPETTEEPPQITDEALLRLAEQEIDALMAIPSFSLSAVSLIALQREYRKQIDELRQALIDVQRQLASLRATQQPGSSQVQLAAVSLTEECSHWGQLLQAHIRYLRQLEIEEAKLGSGFPIHQRIELEERRKRVDELRQQIAINCE